MSLLWRLNEWVRVGIRFLVIGAGIYRSARTGRYIDPDGNELYLKTLVRTRV